MDILKFYLPKMILIVSAISYFQDANGQKRPDPTFDTFIGHYSAMPVIEERVKNRVRKRIQDRYGDNIYDYKKLGDIELDAINIPETTIGGDYFPGVDRYQQFCMILNSKMTILIDGWYEFSLHSDDGSIYILYIKPTACTNHWLTMISSTHRVDFVFLMYNPGLSIKC